ncbi:hypothetical protein ACFL0I_05590 [Gemmatimonadota bacterium]
MNAVAREARHAELRSEIGAAWRAFKHHCWGIDALARQCAQVNLETALRAQAELKELEKEEAGAGR